MHKYPDMRLFFDGINQGLQEFATYNPPGPTKPGALDPVSTPNEKVIVFINMPMPCNLLQLVITLSTNNISDWVIYLHDPHHFANNHLIMYGQEIISVQTSMVSGTWSQYTIEPLEVNHINQEKEPCISDANKITNIWECLTQHMYSRLNCTLPWDEKAKNENNHLCSSPDEYDLFQVLAIESMNKNSEYIEKIAKCIPGCKRTEYSAKLMYSATGDSSLAGKWELMIYFGRDKFPVKEQFYIYGTANLIADFGGYLGLLLGYSLLGFYDNLVDFFEYLFRKCEKKHPPNRAKSY